MAIDFPSNPTNGQVYANYIYDSSITAWRNVNTDTGIGTLNAMGLKNVVPTSVNVASGSATVNANGTVTFSGATSVRLNGIFSSTYQNYRIQYSLATSASTRPIARFAKNGTDSSGSVYATANITYTQGSVTPGGATSTSMFPNGVSGVTSHQAEFILYKPFDATVYSTTYSTGIGGYEGGRIGSVRHLSADSWDGFTILPESGGTISGTITAFGYTN